MPRLLVTNLPSSQMPRLPRPCSGNNTRRREKRTLERANHNNITIYINKMSLNIHICLGLEPKTTKYSSFNCKSQQSHYPSITHRDSDPGVTKLRNFTLFYSSVLPLDAFFFFLSGLPAGISSDISCCQGGVWSLTQPPAPSESIPRTRTEQPWLYLTTP